MSELPEGWATCRLQDAIEDIQAGFASGKKDVKGGLFHLRMNNISVDGKLNLELLRTVPQSLASHNHTLKDGDVLICTTNSGKLVGKCALFDLEGHFAFSNHLTRLRLNPNIIEGKYLLHQLWLLWKSGEFEHKCKHWVNQSTLPKEELLSSEILLAPLNEQRRVVAKLEVLLGRLNAAQARLATIPLILKRFRQSVLVAACSGKLTADWREENPNVQTACELLRQIRERKSNWLKAEVKKGNQEARRLLNKLDNHSFAAPENQSIPESWCWSSLLESCWLVVDCHNKTAPYVSEGIPLVRTTNIKAGRLLIDELKYVSQETYEYWSRRCPPQPGDILLTREAPMGESALIPEGLQLCMGQRMMLLRVFSDLTDVRYIAYGLQDPFFLSRVDENAVGSGVKHLRVGDVESLTIPIPPLAEQQEIVRRVEALFKTADALDARYRTAKAYVDKLTQSILAKAFRGELVPQDPNDEPASVLLKGIKDRASVKKRTARR
jgi:type I restriction enzyme, S subunit